MWSNKLFSRTGLSLLGLCGILFSSSSFALSCREASSGNIAQDITLDQQINVPTANLTSGTVLWRSQSYTSTFECTDTDKHPAGERAFLYWDPLEQMRAIHGSLEVGVTYMGIDFNPVDSVKYDIGQGTSCRKGNNGECLSPATPHTITVTYSVYIKATGNPPPEGGVITDTGRYAIFQVDGEGGLNGSTLDGNFRAYIKGLSNIRFIACNPEITVVANNGAVVDFGRIPARNAVNGTIEKQIPFSVQANLTGAGQACEGQTLMASFSTNYPTQDGTTILPTLDSHFGIVISPLLDPTERITMNTATELGYVNGSVVENKFLAGLLWLSNSPKIGEFNASANIDITFK